LIVLPVRRAAFSLLELLVSLGIISLMLAILVPSLAAARVQSKRVLCLSHQRQIALGMHAYAADFRDRFPIAQYFDQRHSAFVAWDTITDAKDPHHARPGLIWQHVAGGSVQQCPAYEGPSMTTGDPYTGYNYNTTYIGRGENEGPYRDLGQAPAAVWQVRWAAAAALIGDGGWASGANKFMRAPLDSGVPEGVVHAGAQAYRHGNTTNVTFIDGHGEARSERHRKPGALSVHEALLGWPDNGFLSKDDRVYAHR
jgi:prepilin-type processing-associated H-X9-DG protein